MINFTRFQFSPVIDLPLDYEVFDFTKGYDPDRLRLIPFGIGKYNEVRKNMYTTDIFQGNRNIHMGIDIAAPVNHPVKSFYEGEIYLFAYNDLPGDYGHTLIIKHVLDGHELYALYGHLSAASVKNKKVGQKITAGEIVGWIGDKHENGNWNPHLHLQLSYQRPLVCDMPGAVCQENREEALKIYPDPQLVLGKLYE
jgi:murein DD-endopeptidase MepM/ murein hydrolase activator NlpD